MRRIKLARFLQQASDILPRKYPVYAQKPLKAQPFFVFGSGRNGSTMLNRMLNQHPDLFLPSEQYFLGNSVIKYKLYNFLVWRDLVKVIAGELLPATGSTTWHMDVNQIIRPLMDLEDQSLQVLVDIIYRSHGMTIKEFSMWGDTTPLNAYYLPELYGAFPQAKYIFMLRDGRDVVASMDRWEQAVFNEVVSIREKCDRWIQSVTMYEWLAKRADVLVVKYEDLVSAPEHTLRSVTEFLQLDYVSNMLEFNESIPDVYLKQDHHHGLTSPLTQQNVGKWKTYFEKEQKEEIHKWIGSLLKKLGYWV